MQILRKILFPFALLYGFITWSRNKFYDFGIISSRAYDFPVICVGNLNTGGTGKSPMIEYLLHLLQRDYRVASLSRGYKRATTGFYVLSGNETAERTGDEPLQFKQKFKNAIIAVDAKRQRGIGKLRAQNVEVILLDDAFQHRKVSAGLNILLSSYKDLYVDDFLLPTGNLREPVGGAERAQIVVITKCPPELNKREQERIRTRLELRDYQKLFFSYIHYGPELLGSGTLEVRELKSKKFTLVTGIANPVPLINHLKSLGLEFKHLEFPDHHNFSRFEIEKLKKEPMIVTTEKDFVRLKDKLPEMKLYYLPIQISFLENTRLFEREITNFVKQKRLSKK